MNFGKTLLLLPLTLLASVQAEEIRIAASDLLAEYIEAPLEAYGSEYDMTFAINSIGSLPALDRLRSDEIDLAIVAVPEGTEVPREEFSIYPFAYDVAVVAVNESNPIDEISLSHLGGIFGANEEFNFNTWGELGLSGWGSRNIKPLAGTSEESIALELFKYSVFKGGAMKPSVAMVKDTEIEDLLRSDAASIAILSRMPTKSGVKVLMVSSGSDSDAPAFGPSDDNVHYGDYPIRLSFYIAYNKRDAEKLRKVIRELFDDEVAESLRSNDLIALPDTVRRKLLIDLDLE
ncbi:substrate-binding domain-containing protein [Coraliomargarita algicola]|uniref:Substrate-binding domain-containing protein n=1 Tax=Coraliomargarita algicola TaxID=3092156 RepID=A0ABZ0RQU0_9BACT|nr:substrate-binding domain-containing protein [Coraliomargarita sp. J2-16]WPJ97476.1 substrate-binding domain-containing protein [Coraliomargarita sp. J2-16]